MKIHGTAKGAALSTKDFGVAFGGASITPSFDDTDLKGYWKFNEASGNIINVSESGDSLGSGADISMTDGTYGETGAPLGDSVLFDGSTAYGEYGTSLSQFNFMHNSSSIWTLAFWAKWASVDIDEYFLATKTNNDSGTPGFSIRTGSNSQFRTYIVTGSATPLSKTTTNNFIPDFTSWYFYTMTWDESLGSENYKIRRDNANEETGDKGAGALSDSNAGYTQHLATRPNLVTEFGNFTISELSQWNKVVSDDDQTSLYNSGAGREIY